jgi:hypothetical protein
MTYNPAQDLFAALVVRRLLTPAEATRYRTGLRKPSQILLRAWAALGYRPDAWPERATDPARSE